MQLSANVVSAGGWLRDVPWAAEPSVFWSGTLLLTFSLLLLSYYVWVGAVTSSVTSPVDSAVSRFNTEGPELEPRSELPPVPSNFGYGQNQNLTLELNFS